MLTFERRSRDFPELPRQLEEATCTYIEHTLVEYGLPADPIKPLDVPMREGPTLHYKHCGIPVFREDTSLIYPEANGGLGMEDYRRAIRGRIHAVAVAAGTWEGTGYGMIAEMR